MWRGYSVCEDYFDAIDAGALFCFHDAYCDDSNGWSAMSDGSSVGSEAGEPAVFKDIRSARRFIAMRPAEIRQHVEMVAVDDGSTIPSAATSPPTRSGTTAAPEGEDGEGRAPKSRARTPTIWGLERTKRVVRERAGKATGREQRGPTLRWPPASRPRRQRGG